MLTRDLSIVRYERGRALPDLLRRGEHDGYVPVARRLLATYRNGLGKSRRDLHRAVEQVFAGVHDCDPRRVGAFAKVLDEAATYERGARRESAALRLAVFTRARELSEDHDLSEVRTRIASELGRPWTEIEGTLYADAPGARRLAVFRGYETPEALLSRYNVAQVQACLYRAERATIIATEDFKTILRYAKLAGLLHEIRRLGPDRFRIDLAGPASVLGQTRRYGVRFACFLPALIACRGWRFEALVATPWGSRAVLRLSSRLGLKSHLPAPAEFDSGVEERFAREFGEERDGWRLHREAEVLWEGQTAFVPDFVLRHADGREVLFEIVGFWTPQYLDHKRATLARFADRAILVAVPKQTVRRGWIPDRSTVVYAGHPRPADLLERLRRVPVPPPR